MQEIIDNITEFFAMIGAFIEGVMHNIYEFFAFIGAVWELFIFLIQAPFKFMGWFGPLPVWEKVPVVIFGILILSGISAFMEQIVYTGPRGGKYRINSKGKKSYDVR